MSTRLNRRSARTWANVSCAVAAPQLHQMRVIDVRQPHEFCGDLGHLAHAELVPLEQLHTVVNTLDPAVPVLVVCRSGNRAMSACDHLAAAGIETVLNLEGGMLAWNADGRPVCAKHHPAPSASRCAAGAVR